MGKLRNKSPAKAGQLGCLGVFAPGCKNNPCLWLHFSDTNNEYHLPIFLLVKWFPVSTWLSFMFVSVSPTRLGAPWREGVYFIHGSLWPLWPGQALAKNRWSANVWITKIMAAVSWGGSLVKGYKDKLQDHVCLGLGPDLIFLNSLCLRLFVCEMGW